MPRASELSTIDQIEGAIASVETEIAKINEGREAVALAAARGDQRADAKLAELAKDRARHIQQLDDLALALGGAKREAAAKEAAARQAEIAQAERVFQSEIAALLTCAERADSLVASLGEALKGMETHGQACQEQARFLYWLQVEEPTRQASKDEWLRVRDAAGAHRAARAALAHALVMAGVAEVNERGPLLDARTRLSIKAATELATDEATSRLARLKGAR